MTYSVFICAPSVYIYSTGIFCCFAFQNRGNGLDMNVIPAWREGITGKGVVVTILDDGLESDHPDLEQNYVSKTVFDRFFFCLASSYKSPYISPISFISKIEQSSVRVRE